MSTSLAKKTRLRSPSESSFADISDKHLNWVNDRFTSYQSVKFESFVARFNYHNRASARHAYAAPTPSSSTAASSHHRVFKITVMKTAVILHQAALNSMSNNEGNNDSEGSGSEDGGVPQEVDGGSDNYIDNDQHEERDHDQDDENAYNQVQGQDERDVDQDYYSY
ncbi:hypothetical protein BGZ92_010296 [Podila epicladia]|nr:hypothetical protein BGZ92_010296 [Podila epicladia]